MSQENSQADIDQFTFFRCIKSFLNVSSYFEISELFHNNNSKLQPVQSDNVHFLDIHNGGFTAGLNPKKEAFDFLASIEQQAVSINALKQRDEL